MAVKKKRKINLVKALSRAVVEKDVENAYRNAFESEFPGYISSPFGSDGILRNHVVTSTLEFKYDLNMRNSFQQAGVILQSVYYLKKIETSGEALPKAVFVGDVNECFVVPVASVSKYLKYKVNWDIAPSSAAKKNSDLVKEIAQNKDIEPFIYDIDKNFDFLSVVEKMKNISLDKPYAVTITKNNILEIFKRFEKDVVKDKYYTTKTIFDEDKRISELADLFFTCLTAPKEVFLHPNKKNKMIVRGKEIRVNSKNYRIFFSQFRQEYTPVELEAITANKDRILEDTHRRRTGAFFTSDIWVAEAHKMIAEQFGENWKEEYVVWDCACGTANLTRGYKFKELYISTIDQSDINTIGDCGYNPEATVFQYDFLDEIGVDRVPDDLRKAFEDGKKVLFLINPPYGAGGEVGGNSKKDIGKSLINSIMLEDNMRFASKQLYTQFIYKITKLKEKYNCKIANTIFAPPLFMTGSDFSNFREVFYNNFEFRNGMLFKASHFADVKSQWGISFTIWESK